MATNDKRSAAYRSWYEINKEKLSARRKQRYQQDKEYREKALSRASDWRANNPTPSRAGEARIKVVNGTEMRCFRITETSQMIGRSDQTIRDWEEKGIIPKPSVEGVHRFYTYPQVVLMRELGEIIDSLRYGQKEVLEAAIEVKSAEIHQLWKSKE